jgi:serine/threonine protein kinase
VEPDVVAPLLLGRYRPVSLLARGGSSLVYLGRDEHLSRDVAIKLFSAGGESELDRFREELRVLASLSHHGVVSILDAGIDDSSPQDPRPFLVIELARGETIRTILAGPPLTPRRIGEIIFETAEALEYVHARGVIHRDITPSNIMLVDYGTTFSRPRARLTDFGIAIDALAIPDVGEVNGTAAYLSPEQAQSQPLTPASDIYSLGLVLLECFTGTLAFPGTALESALLRLTEDPTVPKAVPRVWAGLIKSMTRRNPAERPTAAEVAIAARAELRASGRRDKA